MTVKNHVANAGRRLFLRTAVIAAILTPTLFSVALRDAAAQVKTSKPMKIGTIGAGKIGGTLGALWVKAGHEVTLSSLDIEETRKLAAPLGPRARAAVPREAAAFGEVILISVPYGAMPQIARDYAVELAGKIVLDTGNPVEGRDGAMAKAALEQGTGLASAGYLPKSRVVRAFTSVGAGALAQGAHRSGAPIAIPLAGDDKEALAVASQLVRDAGFEPVVVGGLADARKFDRGSPVFGRALTASELRRQLGL